MTHALSLNPNVLLLDEPTNHLDRHNRKSLMRLLKSYAGTLIVVSHDTELLRSGTESLLQKISLSMRSKDRIAIQGDNAL